MQLRARMVESWDTTLHLAWLRCLAVRFDGEMADDIDPLPRGYVFQEDSCASYGENLADCWPVQLRDPASGSTEEDVGQRVVLGTSGALVHIEHDFPGRAGYDVVEVADGKYYATVREINAVCMTFIDVP